MPSNSNVATEVTSMSAKVIDSFALPQSTQKAYIFPALQDTSLVSVGQLCDAGCKATFTAMKCKVMLKDELILEGTRSPSRHGLWMMEITAPPVVLPGSKPQCQTRRSSQFCTQLTVLPSQFHNAQSYAERIPSTLPRID